MHEIIMNILYIIVISYIMIMLSIKLSRIYLKLILYIVKMSKFYQLSHLFLPSIRYQKMTFHGHDIFSSLMRLNLNYLITYYIDYIYIYD